MSIVAVIKPSFQILCGKGVVVVVELVVVVADVHQEPARTLASNFGASFPYCPGILSSSSLSFVCCVCFFFVCLFVCLFV